MDKMFYSTLFDFYVLFIEGIYFYYHNNSTNYKHFNQVKITDTDKTIYLWLLYSFIIDNNCPYACVSLKSVICFYQSLTFYEDIYCFCVLW